jgi:hypothetical protein
MNGNVTLSMKLQKMQPFALGLNLKAFLGNAMFLKAETVILRGIPLSMPNGLLSSRSSFDGWMHQISTNWEISAIVSANCDRCRCN